MVNHCSKAKEGVCLLYTNNPILNSHLNITKKKYGDPIYIDEQVMDLLFDVVFVDPAPYVTQMKQTPVPNRSAPSTRRQRRRMSLPAVCPPKFTGKRVHKVIISLSLNLTLFDLNN